MHIIFQIITSRPEINLIEFPFNHVYINLNLSRIPGFISLILHKILLQNLLLFHTRTATDFFQNNFKSPISVISANNMLQCAFTWWRIYFQHIFVPLERYPPLHSRLFPSIFSSHFQNRNRLRTQLCLVLFRTDSSSPSLF